ncbi:MAG: protein-L-isoaspartate(D-aspartate) O-methyltransferase [Actinobacteria bacterium]|nr:protein-L-isoaspartate(D-aspartate) O-methyltransferase [Actinomycetota bacterium]
MARRDIAGRGIRDEAVLRAMRTVPRERFVPDEMVELAYEDHPLPIAEGQTISQPYIVALMASAAELGPGDRVLEVGTGSGYGAAILGCVAGEVWTIERHEQLALGARNVLGDLGLDRVHVVVGDGTLGHAEAAPFDAIVVTAGAPTVPAALLGQLADGGRLVIPVGQAPWGQELLRIRRRGDRLVEDRLGGVRFVPLIGAQGSDVDDES